MIDRSWHTPRALRAFPAITCLLVALLVGCEPHDTPPPSIGHRPMNERAIPITGADIWVREEGPLDAPVIIMLHGFTFSLETFDALAADLSQDHRVVRYDLLGHGRTGPDAKKRYAPSARADVLGEVMDTLGIERAIILGHSLGGTVAWRFAATEPSRLDSLILINGPAFDFSGVEHRPAAPNPLLAAHLTNPTSTSVRQVASFFYANPSAVSDARYAQLVERMQGPGLGQAFLDHIGEFTMPDPTLELAKITAPTLILWGASDRLVPVEQADRMTSALSSARLITYPGVGHVAHEEASERILVDIRAFLEATRQ